MGAPDVLQTVFLDPENEIFSLSLQEYEEMEEERTRKMPEKWPMTVAARQVDDTPVLFIFFFFCIRKTKWEFVFHSRVTSIGQR